MKLTPLGSNQTMIETKDGTQVLFSYRTPVAAYLPDKGIHVKTTTKWSQTTSRHINKWLGGCDPIEWPQHEIDSLLDQEQGDVHLV